MNCYRQISIQQYRRYENRECLDKNNWGTTMRKILCWDYVCGVFPVKMMLVCDIVQLCLEMLNVETMTTSNVSYSCSALYLSSSVFKYTLITLNKFNNINALMVILNFEMPSCILIIAC